MKKTYDKTHAQKTLEAGKQDTKNKAAAEAARRDALMINLNGRRIGKLYFHIKAVEKDPESMAYILGRIGFFPFRAETRLEIDQIELIGVSPAFNRERIGAQIPVYAINVEENGKIISVVLQEELAKQKEGKGLASAVKKGVDLELIKG